MKFPEIQYVRPDTEDLKKKLNDLIERFTAAKSGEEQNKILKSFYYLRERYSNASTLTHIRFTQNTKDEFYEKEQEYFDGQSPEVHEIVTRFFSAMLESQFRDELEEIWGEQLFTLAEKQLKSFSDKILSESVKENTLSTEHTRLVGSALVEIDGEKLTLSQVRAWMMRPDRSERKKAAITRDAFFSDNASELDRIYDDLVKQRHEMAVKQGYENFVEMGYDRLGRSDYNADNVKKFREAVKKYFVPLAAREKEKQARRLGIDKLLSYDESLLFAEGNAKLLRKSSELVAEAQKMYHELSRETGEFFDQMLDQEMMDLESREGKAGGGYCTFVPAQRMPFIFSNFNGTTDDIEVLTHETGHAFQSYLARDLGVEEYIFPTMEAAEIHSMSMEHLTYPWMDRFFGEETEKFVHGHLLSALFFFPYSAAIDEFQHAVYENPELSPEERKQKWLSLENEYLPWRNYQDTPFLESGAAWQMQSHLYHTPFYYIDYALAQISALEYWTWSQENREEAWKSYLGLCEKGGSKSYLKLLETAELSNPFAAGTVEKISSALENYFND